MQHAPLPPDAKNVSCYSVVSYIKSSSTNCISITVPYIRVSSKCVFANSIRILVGVFANSIRILVDVKHCNIQIFLKCFDSSFWRDPINSVLYSELGQDHSPQQYQLNNNYSNNEEHQFGLIKWAFSNSQYFLHFCNKILEIFWNISNVSVRIQFEKLWCN